MFSGSLTGVLGYNRQFTAKSKNLLENHIFLMKCTYALREERYHIAVVAP